MAVERELAQLEGRHGQRADIRVLQRIGESRQPVQNLSAYVQFMAKLDDSKSECAAAGSQPGAMRTTLSLSRSIWREVGLSGRRVGVVEMKALGAWEC